MAQLRTRTRKKSTVARRKTQVTARKGKVKAKEVNKSFLSGLLNSVSKDMKECERLEERISLSKDVKALAVLRKNIKDNTDKLEDEMKECALQVYTTHKGVGQMETPKTRAANKIDIKKFFAKVNKKDFFDTATVPLGEAKNILAGKELEKVTISGRTPQKPDFLKVTPK